MEYVMKHTLPKLCTAKYGFLNLGVGIESSILGSMVDYWIPDSDQPSSR